MKTLISFTTFIILVFVSPSITYAQNLTGNETIESAFIQSQIPTSVFGYVLKDGTTETMSFGSAIWGQEDKVTADHIFRIASMTKAITSVAAMQLVEQGVIGLDDPLNDLMPEMVIIPILTEDGQLIESDDIITLRHLLTHTSGFGYGFIEQRLQDFNKEGWQFEDLPRMEKPGVLCRYGTSTDWVGKVVEKLSGKSLEDYFRDHITGPLGMHATWFNVPEDLQHLIVSYGTKTDSGYHESRRIPIRKVTSYIGGAGLFSSPNDYLRFIHCILNEGAYENGRILSPETVQMLFNNELSDDFYLESSGDFSLIPDGHGLAWGLAKEGSGYGWYGLSAAEDEPASIYDYRKGMGYWGGSYNTLFSIHPKFGYGVVTFHQFSPFGDEDALKLYFMFEQETHKAIIQEQR
jgi:methyl acetate hydrolase